MTKNNCRYQDALSLFPIVIRLVIMLIFLSGCATSPPSNSKNVCDIFAEKRDWYQDTKQAHKTWGVPIHIQMAIIKQESNFYANAQPARKWFLGFIPLGRPSSAYGYAQAIDGTWRSYIKATGNHGADRNDFDDATDFIGWYTHRTTRKLGIAKHDMRNQYLAYHEGQAGYRRGSYKNKKWLLKVARKVDKQSKVYHRQLKKCRKKLDDHKSWWFF